MIRLRSYEIGAGRAPAVDLTPLIDVMVVLVILLALESSFGLALDANRLHAGEGGDAARIDARDIVITFDSDGRLTLDKNDMDLDRLRDTLKVLVESDQVRFILAGDEHAPYGLFLSVEEALKRVGVEQYKRLQRERSE